MSFADPCFGSCYSDVRETPQRRDATSWRFRPPEVAVQFRVPPQGGSLFTAFPSSVCSVKGPSGWKCGQLFVNNILA
ncbi:hypothetical protein GN956_G18876 [Arapaima gigas]